MKPGNLQKESSYRTQGNGGQKSLSRCFSCFEGLNLIFFIAVKFNVDTKNTEDCRHVRSEFKIS